MKVTLYSFVDLYSKGLETLAGILVKGAQHAARLGTAEHEMLDWRLADDMFPLRRQAQIVRDFAWQWPARAAGLDLPASMDGDTSLPDLITAVREAQAYLRQLDAGQFEDRDEVPLTMDIGQMQPTLPIGQWVSGFATTNFYFHLSMAYAILRSKGVPLGKRDLFAAGL